MDALDIFLLILILIFISISLRQRKLIRDYNKSQEFMEKIKERLCETSEKVLMAEDENGIYSIILDTVVDLIPNATTGSVLIIDENDNFRFKAVKGFQEDLVDIALKKEEAYLNFVNGFKETAIIENPRKFDEVNVRKETIAELESKNALDIYCAISAPIYVDNKLIGLLNVDSSKPGYAFTKKELNLMNVIKSELQIALKNAFAQNKLKYLACFDELTGIMNRRRFHDVFNYEIERMKEKPEVFSLIMIDVDGFKPINDNYGHNFGDKVLKHFSNILKSHVNEPDVIARLSGDEFVILFRNCPANIARERMEKITEAVSSNKINNISIGFSYGICEIKDPENITCEEAVHVADSKMYNSKRLKGAMRRT